MKTIKRPTHWPYAPPEQQFEGFKSMVAGTTITIWEFERSCRSLVSNKFMSKSHMYKLIKWFRHIRGISYQEYLSKKTRLKKFRLLPEDNMRKENPRLEKLHNKSSNHRNELEASEFGGCFYCRSFFDPKEVLEWIDDDNTALCPKCGIDSVLPMDMKDSDLLIDMSNYWFDWTVDPDGNHSSI